MAYPLSGHECALESAFANHLIELRRKIGPEFDELVLVCASMTEPAYRRLAGHLAVIDSRITGVRYVPAYPDGISRVRFLSLYLWPTWRILNRMFAVPCVVHSGMSTQLAHPLMFMACLAAKAQGRVVVFMVDIDFRKHSIRNRALGFWSLKSYLINRYLYDPLKWLQLWLAPRIFDLCLYKSRSLVSDFGKGRNNVRDFYDTAYGEKDIVDAQELNSRLLAAGDSNGPLRVTYFGRVVSYKGLDRVVSAVDIARRKGVDVVLRIIGDGESLDALRKQVRAAALQDYVEFIPPAPYGKALFRLVDENHVTVAAPLTEDTPRAAFDSMARGLPVIAFDITYFKDLEAASGAVMTTPWADATGLADAFARLQADRSELVRMSRAAVQFARENTQDIWLDRRVEWMRAAANIGPA